MKKIYILAIACAIGSFNPLNAQIDSLFPKSQVSEVTVFFSGAQVQRKVALNSLQKGKYLIVVNELPAELDPLSVQVNPIAHSTVLSVKHQTYSMLHLKKGKSQTAVEEGIEAKKREMKQLKASVSVLDIEEKLLMQNSSFGNRESVSAVDEIKEAAAYYRQRLGEIKTMRLGLEHKAELLNSSIQNDYLELNKLAHEKQRTYSRVTIALDCERPSAGDIGLQYYVPSAGWQPLYDFRVEDVARPLTLVYHANIFQSTGEDWVKAQLTLSTGNPNLGGNKPDLRPWRLGSHSPGVQGSGRYEPSVYAETSHGSAALQGKVLDAETDEPLPFVNIVLMQNGVRTGGTTSDFEGNYAIKPLAPGRYDLEVTYVGYVSQKRLGVVLNQDKITFCNIKLESGVRLDQFEIVEYSVPLIDKDGGSSGGSFSRQDIHSLPQRSSGASALQVRGARESETSYFIDGIKVRGSTSLPQSSIESLDASTQNLIANTLSQNVTQTEYRIDIPYTVASDGRDHSIRIKERSVEVDYLYYLVPKLDSDAFLFANIPGWGDLDLMDAEASVFFRGTFMGRTKVDTRHSGDTLSLSLGRDKHIVVQRSGNRELNDRRFVGSNVRETVAWDLNLRNNRSQKVKIIVEDQIPVSVLKSVQISLLQGQGATLDEKTGMLTWKLELDPKAQAQITYAYEARYPQYSNALK